VSHADHLSLPVGAWSPTLAIIDPVRDVQGLGFTEEDSAGQSNIFAVEVRAKPCLVVAMNRY
jgi:hypothetical protein